MNQSIQAIYENSLLRPLVSLDLPENSIVEISVRYIQKSEVEYSVNEGKLTAFYEWMESLAPNTPNLIDEQISYESIYEVQIQRQLD